jgi:hypothetical protein
VEDAIKGTAPGKAPGLDGIPGELFKQYRPVLAPILAQLYTAIGTLKECPPGFLDGVVIPVLKPGMLAVIVDSYRPLQLLSYDYRILAKLLANRLLQVAGGIIDPAQCAFLKNRQIGDSIRLLQMLPPLLLAENRTAIAAFLDFRKAYDTVSREFLYVVAETLGLGAGFVSWMKVLLTNTYSCAVVNGFQSPFYDCSAGVRQGCPLAPLLYLLAGQALLCHLKERGIGIDVAGARLVAAQYADDAEPLLPDEEAATPFKAAMDTFEQASGQQMQPRKTHLLPLGRDVQEEAPVAGLQVVSTAKSLGVLFGSRGLSGVDWEDRMQGVKDKLQKISRLPGLSAFGRAFAANGYALSKILYHAQYAGSLPQAHAEKLSKWTAALIDKGLGPEDDLRRAPGFPTACMAAHPRDGGLGLLPVQAHLFSRLACEGVQILIGRADKPWIAAGRALLQHYVPSVPGGDWWGLALCDKPYLFPEPGKRPLPQPLRAMALGLHALPPLEFVGDQAEEPGEWCWHIPLWSNPVLVERQSWEWFGQHRDVGVGLEFVFPGLVGLPELQTVGQAVHLSRSLEGLSRPGGDVAMQDEAYRWTLWGPVLQQRSQYAVRQDALAAIRRLMDAIPPQWKAAANAVAVAGMSTLRSPRVTAASMAAARARVCAVLGWHTRDGTVVRMGSLTVALATRIQSLDSLLAIEGRHADFSIKIQALDAGLLPGRPPPPVRTVLRRWWRLKVPNVYKEAAWRLTLNAFPTAARMHGSAVQGCAACGAPNPDFGHHFWLCPVALAVRQELEGQLRAAGPPMLAADSSISCAALWMGVKPHPGLLCIVWDMVCLAAVHAMNVGRCTAWAVSHAENGAALPYLVVERIASRAAIVAMWDVLADFAATAVIPPAGRGYRLTQQPFLAWHAVVTRGNGLRVIRR